ncbi:MAG: hypothetical protein H6R00_3633 [Proteobacteria bacterium]|nr:hypothetical protein [Pseudomonadota bacterium]
MAPNAALTQLAKQVAADMGSGQIGVDLLDFGESLAAEPNVVPQLLDLLVQEAAKKRPKLSMIDAFAFLIGQALEILRYGVERNQLPSVEAVTLIRMHLLELAQAGKIAPTHFVLILSQFASAKLDPGTDLQAITTSLDTHNDNGSPDLAAFAQALDDLLGETDGDIFAFHNHMAEQGAAYRDGERAAIVAALLMAPNPALAEAAIGWLLDPGPETRQQAASILCEAAQTGRVSPTMLRRLLTVRNWLPESERAEIDVAIRHSRLKGVECAPLPEAIVREIVLTGMDGSGAQSLFAVIRDGRKQAIASVLLKANIGVRDAWVNRGLTKRESEAFLDQVEIHLGCFQGSLDFLRMALSHSLAESVQTATPPPFWLVEVIERLGLPTVNPEMQPTADLIAQLIDGIPSDRRASTAIDQAVSDSEGWCDDFTFVDSWFEDDGAIDDIFGSKHGTKKHRAALLLNEYLPKRREHWARLLAWTASALRASESTGDDWINFALVAREILGGRDLAEIPLMAQIAEKTMASWQSRQR